MIAADSASDPFASWDSTTTADLDGDGRLDLVGAKSFEDEISVFLASPSGGFLPQLSYRFTDAFSVTFGVSFFIGRDEFVPMPVRAFAPSANRAGPNKYQDGVNRLLAQIMRRDEAFMRLRWTF